MKKIAIVPLLLILLFCGIFLSACTVEENPTPSKSRSEQILEEEGYTEISLSGYPIWGCSDSDDNFFENKEFTAKNMTGKTVSGYVCCGFLKGCTIRRK